MNVKLSALLTLVASAKTLEDSDPVRIAYLP